MLLSRTGPSYRGHPSCKFAGAGAGAGAAAADAAWNAPPCRADVLTDNLLSHCTRSRANEPASNMLLYASGGTVHLGAWYSECRRQANGRQE